MNAFEKMREGMFFNPYADEDVSHAEIKDALVQLNLYVNCQAKEYEAKEALQTLESRYGGTVRLLAREFRQAMLMEDEDQKLWACHKRLEMIERYVSKKTGRRCGKAKVS